MKKIIRYVISLSCTSVLYCACAVLYRRILPTVPGMIRTGNREYGGYSMKSHMQLDYYLAK